ncbi:Hypothetical predicted protein [Olea europaea subsp. europaea]|uniref:Uncharacterized protein n=1 Tax=Olea europaea subsp. europaea TaxID=158383 RepID=A0A8S0SBH0_OLEEU|nr:Hypothetical predicted protein [Olea europaea subsp. europaea]
MECAKVVFFTLVLSLAWARGAEEKWIRAAPPCDFPAMYNFGRASDGRLIIDFIAEHLGLPHLSSYLDSIGANYRHGANFASGGSTIRRQNESIFENGLSPFSLDIQIAHFDQFKERTSELYRQDKDPYDMNKLPRPREFSRALYIFYIGQNDLAAGFGSLVPYNLRLQFLTLLINLLWQLHICINEGQGHSGSIILDLLAQNNMAIEFNRQLKTQVTKLRRELPRAALIYVDIYSAKYHLIRKAEYYGFMDPSKICCGHHE